VVETPLDWASADVIPSRDMAVNSIPPSLVPILGRDPGELTEDGLRRLIGVREDDTFDAKSELYGGTKGDKRELCADVAAFANGRGGLILIGAAEESETVEHLTPVPTAGEELRIRQILAAGIYPAAPVDIQIVEAAKDGHGYVVLAVRASQLAPHAVVKNDDLRYPIRDGSGRRFMREPEVANRYSERFDSSTRRLQRLKEIDDRLIGRITGSDADGWLIVSAVPEVGGHAPISIAGRSETQAWLQTVVNDAPRTRAFYLLGTDITTAYRSYLAGRRVAHGSGYFDNALCELHNDGSSSMGLAIGHQWDPFRGSDPPPGNTISETELAMSVVALVHLAGRHAERLGASGSINLTASLRSPVLLSLGHTRHDGIEEVVPDTRSILETEKANHTFDLNDLLVPVRLVSASSLVTTDLVTSFGAGQCLQLDPEGAIRRKYVDKPHPGLLQWAEWRDVPVTDNTV
jgi:hypothetical protein